LNVVSIDVCNFRNIAAQSVSFGPGVNFICGENGQGKTNLVEAISFLSWLKSFRSPRTADLIRVAEGVDCSRLAGTVDGNSGRHEIRAEIGKGWRKVIIDGSPAASARDTMQILAVSCLSPEDPAILEGGPEGRRMLLDRFSAMIEPGRTVIFSTWAKLVRERNTLLRAERRDADHIDAVEQNMAGIGAEYAALRLDAVRRIAARLPDMLGAMTGADLFVRLGYSSRWLRNQSAGASGSEFIAMAAQVLRAELAARREADTTLGYTSSGPHVDDLEVSLEGLKAKGHASRGQKKVLMLAWKAAEAAEIAEVRGAEPVLVLDDALADLDPGRQSGVVAYLRGYRGQSFITSAGADPAVFREAVVIRASRGVFSAG